MPFIMLPFAHPALLLILVIIFIGLGLTRDHQVPFGNR